MIRFLPAARGAHGIDPLMASRRIREWRIEVFLHFIWQFPWSGFTRWPAIGWSSRVKSCRASFRRRITTMIIDSSSSSTTSSMRRSHSNHDRDRRPAADTSSKRRRPLIIRRPRSADQHVRGSSTRARFRSGASADTILIGTTAMITSRRPTRLAASAAATVTNSTRWTAVISCSGSSIPKGSRSIGNAPFKRSRVSPFPRINHARRDVNGRRARRGNAAQP